MVRRIATAVLFLAAAAFAVACWRGAIIGHPHAQLDQWHHAYLAVPIAALGWWRRSAALLCVAAVLAGDDAWQHVRQVAGAWDYRSPLHQAFAQWLWPLEPVQWAVKLLDRLLG